MSRRFAGGIFSNAHGLRRALATPVAVFVVGIFGFHAVLGQNGLIAYAHKRSEDRALKAQIQVLDQENTRLRERVAHLQSDPDAVELEARQRLHYARTGEVIYTLAKPMDGNGLHSAEATTR